MRPFFDESKIHYYKHWSTGAEFIDMEFEAQKVAEEVKDWSDYFVFAKSIGGVLTLKGIYEKTLRPIKCLFVGAAIFEGGESNFPVAKWVEGYSTPTLFIQKTADPVVSFNDLKNYLGTKDLKNYSLKEIPGDNHSYDDLEYLKEEMTEFIKGS